MICGYDDRPDSGGACSLLLHLTREADAHKFNNEAQRFMGQQLVQAVVTGMIVFIMWQNHFQHEDKQRHSFTMDESLHKPQLTKCICS